MMKLSSLGKRTASARDLDGRAVVEATPAQIDGGELRSPRAMRGACDTRLVQTTRLEPELSEVGEPAWLEKAPRFARRRCVARHSSGRSPRARGVCCSRSSRVPGTSPEKPMGASIESSFKWGRSSGCSPRSIAASAYSPSRCCSSAPRTSSTPFSTPSAASRCRVRGMCKRRNVAGPIVRVCA